jgi:hypothetical protein
MDISVNVRDVLGKAGRAFLRAFLAAALTYSTGVLAAPNLNQAYALGVAALAASVAAGLAAVQAYVPALTFKGTYAELLNSFTRAALAAFLVSVIGILNAPDLSVGKSAIVGVVIGAISAGLRALQGAATPGDAAAKFGTTGV